MGEELLVARTGRQRQRYSDEGHRLVAGCIPVRLSPRGTSEILLITTRGSSADKGWIFPKGGWETDETSEQAAARESLEEAGVRGVLKEFDQFTFESKSNTSIAHLFVMQVTEELSAWPEQAERIRRWMHPEEAILLCRRAWMQQALKLCLQRGLMPGTSPALGLAVVKADVEGPATHAPSGVLPCKS